MCTLQYYLEKNLDARMRELEREAELEEKAPKIKAKSKMSKVSLVVVITSIMKQERKLYSFISLCCSNLSPNLYFVPLTGREGSAEEAEKASISAGKTKIKRSEEF